MHRSASAILSPLLCVGVVLIGPALTSGFWARPEFRRQPRSAGAPYGGAFRHVIRDARKTRVAAGTISNDAPQERTCTLGVGNRRIDAR